MQFIVIDLKEKKFKMIINNIELGKNVSNTTRSMSNIRQCVYFFI